MPRVIEQLTVKILDRDYRLSCEPGERDQLLATVAYVDGQMQTIRNQGKVAGADRIAVFAALSIASELLSKGAGTSSSSSASTSIAAASPDGRTADERPVADEEILRRIRSIHALLDHALVDQERLF